jgi:hypothetical protein
MFAFLSLLQQFSRRKASANSVFGCLYFPSSELSARLCARPLRASIGVLVNREGKAVKNFSRAYGKMLVRKIDQPLSEGQASRATVIDDGVFVGRCAREARAQGDEFHIQKHYASVLEGLKVFEDHPLVASGYKTLFELRLQPIERRNRIRCGRRFPQLHSVEGIHSQIVEQRSRFYERPGDGPAENAPYVDNSYKWAGGGFLSTAEELLRFGSALLQAGILNAPSLKTMFASQKNA